MELENIVANTVYLKAREGEPAASARDLRFRPTLRARPSLYRPRGSPPPPFSSRFGFLTIFFFCGVFLGVSVFFCLSSPLLLRPVLSSGRAHENALTYICIHDINVCVYPRRSVTIHECLNPSDRPTPSTAMSSWFLISILSLLAHLIATVDRCTGHSHCL